MKKFIVLLGTMACLTIYAQDESKMVRVQPRLVEFNGGNYNGNVADVDAPPDLVENAIKERFKLQGVKPKEQNGFMVFRNVRLGGSDTAGLTDAFIKVEKKSRKEKEISVVYLITARPGEIGNDKLKSGVPAPAITAAAFPDGFLTGLSPDIGEQVYNRDLSEKQAVIKKAEKKLKDMQDDQASLEKKIKNLQDDLESNRKAQQNQAGELEKLRTALADFIAARTDSTGKK